MRAEPYYHSMTSVDAARERRSKIETREVIRTHQHEPQCLKPGPRIAMCLQWARSMRRRRWEAKTVQCGAEKAASNAAVIRISYQSYHIGTPRPILNCCQRLYKIRIESRLQSWHLTKNPRIWGPGFLIRIPVERVPKRIEEQDL